MHCIRGRNQQSPAPQAPPTTNHQQHQQGQWRQARGGRSAESTGVLTFLGCITMPYWNNWYLQKWFFVNEVMVLLYIIVLSFFDHVFSFLPATEIDSQWMSTNSRVLWLMQFKKILRKDVTELRDARAFSFPWLTMVYGGCGVAGLPYFFSCTSWDKFLAKNSLLWDESQSYSGTWERKGRWLPCSTLLPPTASTAHSWNLSPIVHDVLLLVQQSFLVNFRWVEATTWISSRKRNTFEGMLNTKHPKHHTTNTVPPWR